MSSLDRLKDHLAEFRGEVAPTMTKDQLKMELGFQLMTIISPGDEGEVCHLPVSAVELEQVFEGASWHYNESWTDCLQSTIITSDGQVVVVRYEDQLTYEIVDEPLLNVG